MFSRILFIILFASTTAFASYEGANKTYGQGTISLSGYRRTIIELVDGGYHFSVVPWIKDYLVKNKGSLDNEIENALDRVIQVVGVKSFESLPEKILERSKSANIRYILAKRLFNRGRTQDAISELSRISSDHQAYPFAVHLKGIINASVNNNKEANENFNDCIKSSDKFSGKSDSVLQKQQYSINRDYCIAGIARVQFAAQNYSQAELNYLDISKESFVWPEILFEEAWNSYYLRNFNRTLGKLVSYKAPVFGFIFKPEIEVLKAMTYMKMCLYEDAKTTADTFYDELLKPTRELRQHLLKKGKNYNYFYSLMSEHEEGKSQVPSMLGNILNSIGKDAAFIEMKGSIGMAIAEYNNLRKKNAGSMKTNLMKNIQTVLEENKKTVGSYVRSGLVSKYAELYTAFQEMSYIKLEVLAQRKEKLYQSDTVPGKKRGDVRYIERNDKQYFWTFNGEFWADELGDYVFALRSEC